MSERNFHHYAPKANGFRAVCGADNAPKHRLTFYVSEVTCATCKIAIALLQPVSK